MTSLIILTDVLFLSQKKRIFPSPCHLCKLKQAGDCFGLILIIKAAFSLSFHVFGPSAELQCFSDFACQLMVLLSPVFLSPFLLHCERKKNNMQMQNAFLSPFSLQFTFYHPCIHIIACILQCLVIKKNCGLSGQFDQIYIHIYTALRIHTALRILSYIRIYCFENI